jgi:predicted transposase YdaD
MKTGEYEKTFVDRIRDDGKVEGKAEGKAEGRAEGKADSVLKLLERRHLVPSQEQRHRVASCTDIAQLDLWFDRAVTASTATEVFTD